MAVDIDTLRGIALALPAVTEGRSYGTLAFHLRHTLLARLREDGETLVLKMNLDHRDMLCAAEPETFFFTDHYRGYPLVLIRLASIGADRLRLLFREAWREVAPPRLRAQHPDL